MAKQVVRNYTFNTAAKTITLTDLTTARLDRLLLIVDTTTTKILYNFADSGTATATAATNVITLSALQGGEANGDKLAIVYDTAVDEPLYSDSATPTASARTAVAFTTTTAAAVAATDAGIYGWVSVQITSQGTSSTVTFQCSNDNTNWYSASLALSSANGAAVANSTTSALLYHGALPARYFRLNITGISAGTTAGIVEFSTVPKVLSSYGIVATQTGTWTVQPGNTANTTPWLVGHAAVTTGGYSYSNITTATTTTVKSGAGTLRSINVNTAGTGTTTITVYDNTAGSGTKIATINALNVGTREFDIAFTTGLTLVTAGTTAPDVSVAYK